MALRTKYLFILLAAGALLFLFKIGERDLWEPDEARYAVVTLEMQQGGNWIVPHLNGAIYAEKPPLFFWLVHLSVFFLGENSPLANRLPSALAGLVVIILTFLFGERLFNSRTGFLSSLVLATCFFFPQLSRWMMLDSLFTLFFLLTLFCFYLGYEKEERRRRYYGLAGLFIGLGVLTKGPLVYVTLPIFLIFAASQKKTRDFWCRDLLLGFLLSMILVLIWWIPACWVGGKSYVHRMLFKQAVGRYVGGIEHFHSQPFYLYFIRFPAEFFPWTVFLPAAFISGLRKKAAERKEFVFLSIWFFFLFLFFTLSTGKKDNYLLPLYPAAAIMVGRLWDIRFRSEGRQKGFLPGLFLLPSLFLVALILFLSKVPERWFLPFAAYHALGLSAVSYLFAGSFLSLLFFVKRMARISFMSLVIAFALFHLHISHSLPPKLNPERSAKAFSGKILQRVGAGDELKTCFFEANGLLYYTGRPYIENIKAKQRFLEVFNSSQRVFIVTSPVVLDRLRKDTGLKLDPVEKGRVGSWECILISNH